MENIQARPDAPHEAPHEAPHQEPPPAPSTERPLPPKREALLRMIEAQRRPTPISALAAGSGWHENTVRGHVYALWEGGYLTRSSGAPDGRGRPSWLWEAKDRRPGSAYAALAGALAEALARTSAAPEREAREAGRAWGPSGGAELRAERVAELGDEFGGERGTAAGIRDRVIEAMREQGFAPRLREAGETGGAPVIALRQCPLIEAASRHPSVVCAVHLGMVAGVVEALGGEDGGSELIPFSAPGECTLRLAVAS